MATRAPTPTRILAGVVVTLCACEIQTGTGERGTTRHCAAEDATTLGAACYRQCADLLEPSCTAMRKDGDGVEVEECAKDPTTGAYLIEDDALVVPAGETECFALLADPDGSSTITQDDISAECLDVGANVEFAIVRDAAADIDEGVCYDFNCKVSQDADDDCPDLD